MITARADYGGAPQQIYRLIAALPPHVEVFIACPRDYPYWERYADKLGEARMVEIPHRRLTLRHIL